MKRELSSIEAGAVANARAEAAQALEARDHAVAVLALAEERLAQAQAKLAAVYGDVAEARGLAVEALVIEDARDPENERLVVTTVDEVQAREAARVAALEKAEE